MSDHLDAPGLKSPNMDAREDSTDISAFQNPADPTRSFLAMSLFTGVRGTGILGSTYTGSCIKGRQAHDNGRCGVVRAWVGPRLRPAGNAFEDGGREALAALERYAATFVVTDEYAEQVKAEDVEQG